MGKASDGKIPEGQEKKKVRTTAKTAEKTAPKAAKTAAKAAPKGTAKAPKSSSKTAKGTSKAAEKDGVLNMDLPGEGYEFIHDLDQYLYDKGVHYDIFRKLGAHPSEKDGVKGVHFAVWAPHAAQVNLIGEFNGWDEENIALERLEPSGIWECFVEEAQVGEVILVDGCGYCHHIEVAVANLFYVSCTDEAMIVDGILQQLVAHFERGVVALHQSIDALLVHVKTYGFVLC